MTAASDDAEMCADKSVNAWLLAHLAKNNMQAPNWKGYEVARDLILDPDEWTTDNDFLTPSLKVKLRNLLAHHEQAIKSL